MYIPASFEMSETEEMMQFISQHSFAILFSEVKGRPSATHLPILFERGKVALGQAARDGELGEDGNGDGAKGKLVGHFAKANPHWRELDGAEVLVVFSGPHAYISPSWYVEKQAVPTWNYVAVHVSGKCRVITDAQKLHVLLAKTAQFYESTSPLLEHLEEEFYVKMENAVVGIEIEITEIEGKAKLSQNKSVDTIRGVIEGLRHSNAGLADEVADLMQVHLDARVRVKE